MGSRRARPSPRDRPRPRRAGGTAQGSARRRRGNVPLVEVELPRDPSEHWLREATERWRLRARLSLCRPVKGSSSRVLQLVEIAGPPEDLDALERHLRRRSDTSELTVLPVSSDRRFVRAVSPMPQGCRRAFEAGAACLNCQLLPGETADRGRHWTLMLPSTPRALRRVGRGQARAEARSPLLLGMRRFAPRRSPTPRQVMAIETAYRLGYYAFPRRTGLGQLARVLSVSRSTASELLRRAEGAMLARELEPPSA